MTRIDLLETATERYQQLKEKLRFTNDVKEKYKLRMKIVIILEVIVYVFENMTNMA